MLPSHTALCWLVCRVFVDYSFERLLEAPIIFLISLVPIVKSLKMQYTYMGLIDSLNGIRTTHRPASIQPLSVSERDATEAEVARKDQEGQKASTNDEVADEIVGRQPQQLEVILPVPDAEGVVEGAGAEVEAREVQDHEGGEDVLVEGGVVEDAQVGGQLREGEPARC